MNAFEIQTLKALDALNVKDQTLVVGVSGGIDSVVLASVLHTLQTRRNLRLVFAYIHHGDNGFLYRDQAQEFVRKLSEQYQALFATRKHQMEPLHSEADLREFRYEALKDIQRETGAEHIVLAHHANDLLETRLMRLLRGVGPQGLESMRVLKGGLLRPFLAFTREEIHDYALSRGIGWMEDPSNSVGETFRNWIRNSWLPLVEVKRPGSILTLMSSLEVLTEEHNDQELVNNLDGIDRIELVKLSFRDQRRAIAHYISEAGLKDYSVTHIDEILKRLDSPQKEFTFTVLKRNWRVDTKRIRVEFEP